jgi:hypothetical protein
VSDIYNLVRYNDWANYAYDKGDDEALESNETAISDLRTKLRKRIKDTLIEMSKNNSIIIKSSSL